MKNHSFGFDIKWEKSWKNRLRPPTGHDKLTLEETLKLEVFPEAGKIAQFSRLAYVERADILKFLKGTHPRLIEPTTFKDWTLICTGRNDQNSYVGAAFYGHGNKGRRSQLIITHRGTEDSKDWEANADSVLKNLVTGHLVSACIFAQKVATQVIQILGSGKSPSLIVTGHSLGGWLAQITSLTLKYMELPEEGYKDISTWKRLSPSRCHPHCAAFDSPGAKLMLNYLNNVDKIEGNTSTSKMNLDITNYVFQMNLVNTVNEHAFDMVRIAKNIRIDAPRSCESTMDTINNINYTNQVHNIQLLLDLLGSKFENNQNFYGNTPDFDRYLITNWHVIRYPATFIGSVVEKSRGLVRRIFQLSGTIYYMLRHRSLEGYSRGLAETNPEQGQGILETIPSVNLESLSDNEKKIVETLRQLRGLLINVDIDSVRVVSILFKEFSPLLDLSSRTVKVTEVGGRLKFEEKIDILHFQNAAIISNVAVDEHLFKWVVDSEKYYSEFWKNYGSPDFSSFLTFPQESNQITSISEQRDILLLNLVSNTKKKSNTVLLLHPRTEEEIKSLRNIQSSCHIILDCGMIIPDFNFYGNITYLRIDEQSALHNFTLDSETIGRIMNTEINIDGKITNLSELGIDSGRLVKFLKTHPADLQKILQSLDKKQIMIGPFAKSIFDSDFVYMQIGEKYSEQEFKNYCQQNEEMPQSHKVFVGNRQKLNLILEKVRIPKSSYSILENPNSCFETFKTICKSKPESTVDLWEFDGFYFTHSYQYNKDFYVDRFIQQPVVDDLELCDILGNLHNIKVATVDGYSVELKDKTFTKQDKLCLKENEIHFYDTKGNYTSVLLENIQTLIFYKKKRDLKLQVTRNEDKLRFSYQSFTTVEDKKGLQNEKKCLILSDEPGMGKSTALLKRLPLLRKACKLLTFVELKSFALVETNQRVDRDENFLEWFIEAISINLRLDTFSRFLLAEMVNGIETGDICMVFDGYDEMGDASQKVFIAYLKKLRDIPSIRIIVSTRPHHREELEQALQTRAYQFIAIEKKDRAEFLAQNWRQILRTESVALTNFAEKVISTVHLPLVNKREEFLGVPLQLRILTEIFLKPLKEYLDSVSNSMSLKIREENVQDFIEKDWTLAKIYNKYVERRLRIYLQEKLSYSDDQAQLQCHLSNTINPPLFILAGKFIFGSSELKTSKETSSLNELLFQIVSIIYGKRNTSASDEFTLLLLKTGLLYGNKDKPEFLHKTFAEYYIAKCLVEVVVFESLECIGSLPTKLKDLTTQILFSDFILDTRGKVIRTFLTAMLDENVEIKDQILSFEPSGFVACHNGRTLRLLTDLQLHHETTFLTFCINSIVNTDIIAFFHELELNPLTVFTLQHFGLFVMLRKLYKTSKDEPVFTDFYQKSLKFSINTLIQIQSWLKRADNGTGISPFVTETRHTFVANRPILSEFLLSSGYHLTECLTSRMNETWTEFVIMQYPVFRGFILSGVIATKLKNKFKAELAKYGYCDINEKSFDDEIKQIENIFKRILLMCTEERCKNIDNYTAYFLNSNVQKAILS